MRIQTQSVNFNADQKLLAFIDKKIGKLETFLDSIINGEVFLKVENDSKDRKNKWAEVKLFVPGGALFAKEQATSFEAAIDLTMEKLKSQIRRYKGKNGK